MDHERNTATKQSSVIEGSSRGLPKAPPIPCGSCPYRRDVPSGIWDKHEYDKLLRYDGETWEQSPIVFMCHQRDGHLCGGWLACHGPGELLALRFPGACHSSAYNYKTDVPVFKSGAEAREHGLRDIDAPQAKAGRMIAGLVRKRDTKAATSDDRRANPPAQPSRDPS